MNSKLMKEFEELEGLGNQVIDEVQNLTEDKDDDDSFKPANASQLSSNDVFYELEKRSLKSTGFPDTDKEILQRAFDEEFKSGLEEARARKREKQRKAAQQLGLQRRRMLMEKTLQEEQDELSRNHQVALMIDLVKENLVHESLRIEVNSVSARVLAKAMWANDSITCLDLTSNDLNDHAGSYLARILKRNGTLKKIELDNNFLGTKSCQAFGEALLVNTSLVYLSLDSNPIISADSDYQGFKMLCESLRTNKTLTSLNLWRCGIDSDAGSILASEIANNDSILFCDIGHNEMDAYHVKAVIDKLDENLAAFEVRERQKRADQAAHDKEKKREDSIKEAEEKQQDLSKWLKERREQRAEDKRIAEEQRVAAMIEEMAERKRLADIKREEDRKAAEAAAEKKRKKAAAAKGKK